LSPAIQPARQRQPGQARRFRPPLSLGPTAGPGQWSRREDGPGREERGDGSADPRSRAGLVCGLIGRRVEVEASRYHRLPVDAGSLRRSRGVGEVLDPVRAHAVRGLHGVAEVLLLHRLQLRDAQPGALVRQQRPAGLEGVALVRVLLDDRLDLRIAEVPLAVGGGELGHPVRAHALGVGQRLGVRPALEGVRPGRGPTAGRGQQAGPGHRRDQGARPPPRPTIQGLRLRAASRPGALGVLVHLPVLTAFADDPAGYQHQCQTSRHRASHV
jgi:hypothetical protein